MFTAIRRAFSRIFTTIRAFRAAIYGLAAVSAAWIFLAPPSATERAVLPLSDQDGQFQHMLWVHRGAKLLQVVMNDRILDAISENTDGSVSVAEIEDSINFAASGDFGQVAANENLTAEPTQEALAAPRAQTTLRAGGAKFISVTP